MIGERAPAKVNLLLHVNGRRPDGLHELCSIFASIELADELSLEPASGGEDRVVCPGVEGETNSCSRALAALRDRAGGELPPLEVRIAKRIPVAAGLGGGSAHAAATLRAANRLLRRPLAAEALREIGAGVGADVPSQIDPRHALVRGFGEIVEPIALPGLWLVLVPSRKGLATAEVYAEADRLGATRTRLDPEAVRRLAAQPLAELARGLENDLEPAAVRLRPGVGQAKRRLLGAGALTAGVTGSGPTVFGVFERQETAVRAADDAPDAILSRLRG